MVKKTKRKAKQQTETDSAFFLKLVLYLVVGAQWLWFVDNGTTVDAFFPIPIGLIIGSMFAAHDQFAIDRKIEFAVLLISMFVGFWARIGMFIYT